MPMAVAVARVEKPAPAPSEAKAHPARVVMPPDEEVMGPPLPTMAIEDAVARAGSEPARLRPASLERRVEPMPPAAKAPAVRPALETSSAGKHGAASVYTVQLGAFKTRRNAEDLITKLPGKRARILEEGGLYRVMSGSFASKKDATLHEASLKRAGYTTFLRTAVF